MAKNVVITGATSGIGEAIARAYLEQGENVVLTGRRTDRLEDLKSEFAETFPNQTVWTFPLDVTDVTSQPRRVQITDMTIMANQQATGFMVHKK